MTKLKAEQGQIQRAAYLMSSYLNSFPAVAQFRKHLSAEERWLSHWSLRDGWKEHLKTHHAYCQLSSKHQKALTVVHDQYYQFQPGCPIGNLFQECAEILGHSHRLLLINPFCNDIQQLETAYYHLRKSKLTKEEAILTFQVGDFARKLYDEAHLALYQEILKQGGS
jgi:hypothetical protein